MPMTYYTNFVSMNKCGPAFYFSGSFFSHFYGGFLHFVPYFISYLWYCLENKISISALNDLLDQKTRKPTFTFMLPLLYVINHYFVTHSNQICEILKK